MDALCPHCQQTMQWRDGHFFCERCSQAYQRQALCPDCGKPLQELKACGAVDYFCQNGHGLISRKRVNFNYIPL